MTPHRHRVECIQQENPYGWWVGGLVVLSGNITTSWLQLASWNLPDSKMEPSVAKREEKMTARVAANVLSVIHLMAH